MLLKKIYDVIDELAPFALSQEYITRFGAHDNSGVNIDCGAEITGAVFSLDLSAATIEAAKKNRANLIVTHHPAIYMPISRLTAGDGILECAKAGISVISAHLNLDAANGGIDQRLMQGLGGKVPLAVYEQLTNGGYGRVYEVDESSLGEFVERAKKTFHTERVVSYGNRPVKRVASFCGGGFDNKTLAFAFQNGADTLVSSDGKHHLIAEAVEKGLNVVLLTHYAAETYGFHKFYLKVKERVGIPCDFFADERLL